MLKNLQHRLEKQSLSMAKIFSKDELAKVNNVVETLGLHKEI